MSAENNNDPHIDAPYRASPWVEVPAIIEELVAKETEQIGW